MQRDPSNPYAHALPTPWPLGPGPDPYSAAAAAPAVLNRYDADRSGALEPHEFRRLVSDARAGRVDPSSMATPGIGSLGGAMGAPAGPGQGLGWGAWSAPMGSYAPPAPPLGQMGGPPPFGSGAYLYGSSPGEASRALAAAIDRAEHSAAAGGPDVSHGSSGDDLGKGQRAVGDRETGAPMSSSLMMAPSQRASPSLLEAYHARLSGLAAAHARLMAKREVLVHRLARAAARRESLASERRAIERETVADCEAILHRLRSAEALRASLLDHGAQLVSGDVRAIDQFSAKLRQAAPAAFGGSVPGGPDQSLDGSGGVLAPSQQSARLGLGGAAQQAGEALQFLRGYPELCADADRLLAKPVSDPEAALGPESGAQEGGEGEQAEAPAAVRGAQGALPRETAERNALLRRHQELLRLLGAKDALIALLLQEREAASKDARAMGDAAEGEVARWQSLAGRLAGELNALQRRAGLETEGNAGGPSGTPAELGVAPLPLSRLDAAGAGPSAAS